MCFSHSVAEAKMALVELKLASLLLQYAPDTGITFQLLQTIVCWIGIVSKTSLSCNFYRGGKWGFSKLLRKTGG